MSKNKYAELQKSFLIKLGIRDGINVFDRASKEEIEADHLAIVITNHAYIDSVSGKRLENLYANRIERIRFMMSILRREERIAKRNLYLDVDSMEEHNKIVSTKEYQRNDVGYRSLKEINSTLANRK